MGRREVVEREMRERGRDGVKREERMKEGKHVQLFTWEEDGRAIRVIFLSAVSEYVVFVFFRLVAFR